VRRDRLIIKSDPFDLAALPAQKILVSGISCIERKIPVRHWRTASPE
jgi:hypothetical protein